MQSYLCMMRSRTAFNAWAFCVGVGGSLPLVTCLGLFTDLRAYDEGWLLGKVLLQCTLRDVRGTSTDMSTKELHDF